MTQKIMYFLGKWRHFTLRWIHTTAVLVSMNFSSRPEILFLELYHHPLQPFLDEFAGIFFPFKILSRAQLEKRLDKPEGLGTTFFLFTWLCIYPVFIIQRPSRLPTSIASVADIVPSTLRKLTGARTKSSSPYPSYEKLSNISCGIFPEFSPTCRRARDMKMPFIYAAKNFAASVVRIFIYYCSLSVMVDNITKSGGEKAAASRATNWARDINLVPIFADSSQKKLDRKKTECISDDLEER